MSLRFKITISVIGAILLFAGFGALLQRFIITPGFMALERMEAERNLRRVVESIKREVQQLEPINQDWGGWDHTYQFAADENPNFVAENLNSESFKSARLDLIYIFNTQRQLLWGKLYDKEAETIGDWDLLRGIDGASGGGFLLDHPNEQSLHSGVVRTDQGMMLVSSVPILTSEKKGPMRGTLVMGRRLDPALVEILRAQTSVQFHLHPWAEARNDPGLAAPLRGLAGGSDPVVLDGHGPDFMHGYARMEDLLGRSVMLVEAVTPRTILQHERRISQLFLLLMTVGGVVVVLVLLVLLRRLVTSPLGKLSQHVADFGATMDPDLARPPSALMVRGDEIGLLTRVFDRMARQLARVGRELLTARDQAVQASQAKSLFLAQMSHEIRTPMNGVLGMLTLLGQSGLGREQSQLLKDAHDSAEQLLAILNDILDFSKIEAGRIVLEETPFDLPEALERVVRMMSAKAAAKGLSCHFYGAPNLPRRVVGDPLRLSQVLNNLLGNAIKFTARGEVFLGCGVEEGDGARVRLRFQVRDTGIGIPPGVREQLFQPFVQAEASTARQYGGTGLGLVICRRLIGLMGGEITIQDLPEGGALFSFDLTLRRAEEEIPPTPWPRPGRVLVLESQATGRFVLFAHLLSLGMRPESVDNVEAVGGRVLQAEAEGDPFQYGLLEFKSFGATVSRLEALVSQRGPRWILMADADDLGRMEAFHPDGWLRRPVSFLALAEALRGDGAVDSPSVGREVELAGSLEGKVLLVEDQAINQRVARGMMAYWGVTCLVAQHGREALEIWQRERLDLILMDVQMPVMGGLEATRRIRALERERRLHPVPILAMTADAGEEDRAQCLEAGMDGHVAKPVRKEILYRHLASHLSRRSPLLNLGGPPAPDVQEGGVLDLHVFEEVRKVMGKDFKEMVESFLATSREQGDQMRACWRQGDGEGLARVAHALKGNARMIGAVQIGDLGEELQKAGEGRNMHGVESRLQHLDAQWAQLQHVIKERMAL